MLKYRFSAGYVGEFLQFSLLGPFSRINFVTKLVNFLFKLVLPIILKEMRSIFLLLLITLIAKIVIIIF